ncbi:hypothetical protein [Clostridium sp.]|uniref:hypothetical protein n=1 Tax=Clostridium sp. TaxID=1506 RepID=UPI001A5FC383|nr:hypothetical protein [Clostridium sp.]MBK5241378.1 hypothetical protein [Clostridium sp.]
MVEIIIQYILILLLVIGLGYLVYLLKDNDVNIVDDYYGLNYVILGSLDQGEATAENAKKIIRVISKTVQYVETNYKDMDNNFKEEKAIQMAKHATNLLCFQSNIDDESIKYLVRLAVALLPPTNNTID